MAHMFHTGLVDEKASSISFMKIDRETFLSSSENLAMSRV